MGSLSKQVDALGDKIGKLLHKYESLQKSHSDLEKELADAGKAYAALEDKLQKSRRQNETVKTANAMLGSNQHKRETKLKINTLIRDIDQCITQLSK